MTETLLPSRRTALLDELRVLLPIALPLAGANLAQMTMGLTDTLMVGTLRAPALAPANLGGALARAGPRRRQSRRDAVLHQRPGAVRHRVGGGAAGRARAGRR